MNLTLLKAFFADFLRDPAYRPALPSPGITGAAVAVRCVPAADSAGV
ncbi:hypothetical protein [Pseudomonas fluorescens]|jgi:hypothetical protein